MATYGTTKALVSLPPWLVSEPDPSRAKGLVPRLHHGEFQHQNCVVGLLQGSDHDGVVRISVGHSYLGNDYLLFTRHNFSPTRSVTRQEVTGLLLPYTSEVSPL